MKRYETGIRQRSTHSALVGQGEPGESPLVGALGLDAIIVPGARKATYLDHAVTLARASNCSLVVLCSWNLDGREVKEYLDARSFTQVIVIDLPPGYSHPLFNFRRLLDIKDQLPPACGHYVTDLSMKRNVGLVLARMLGWQRIFFLDDDIRDITHSDLQRTVGMLGSFSAAGMWVTDFPDNSIVCHANRLTGGSQDVFVSGAALAVDCESYAGFFPDIYNEDWFFFFDAVAKRQLGNSYLKATHLRYYPFTNPDRAASQEFGDVLAEGLYELLYQRMGVEYSSRVYWSLFLEARRNFLEDTLSRVDEALPDMQNEITASLHSALKCLSGITPDLCARYVEAWRQDLKHWKRRWARIRLKPSVDAALAELGLAATPSDSTKRLLHPMDRATVPLTREPVAIPELDTLRKIAEHYGAPRETPGHLDEKRTTRPLAIVHEHGRHRRRTAQRSGLASAVHISVIYCQLIIMRIVSLARMRTP